MFSTELWKLFLCFVASLLCVGCGASAVANGGGSTPVQGAQWEWTSGSNGYDALGIYPTIGASSSTSTPGARVSASTWTDANGNLWLFGGYGLGASGAEGDLNDLWERNSGQWTWISGSSATEQSGVYGTKGTPSTTNTPGARGQAVSWTDAQGNFWLFGGLGRDANGSRGYLNDLWKFSSGKWVWVSGTNVVVNPGTAGQEQPGVYGQLGVPTAGNMPGARESAVGWTDTHGNLWLFGGLGVDSQVSLGYLNDLWEFNGSAWVWMSGSELVNQVGVYGLQGQALNSNVPGARSGSVAWTDTAGNLWVFGGDGYDATGTSPGCATPPYQCILNDLWKFDGKLWTWVSGANVVNSAGQYGTLGVVSAKNVPGSRSLAVGWSDGAGDFYLYGGDGLDSGKAFGDLNDVWEFNGTSWVWLTGSSNASQLGSYGSEGALSASNTPGARDRAAAWSYAGKGWIFGGEGLAVTAPATSQDGKMNDLWTFQP